MNNLKIGTKISVLVVALGAICLAIAGYGALRVKGVDDAYTVMTDVRMPAQVALIRANRSVSQMGYASALSVISADPSHTTEAVANYKKARAKTASYLEAAAAGLPKQEKNFVQLQDKLRRATAAMDRAVALAEQGRKAEASVALEAAAPVVASYSDLAVKMTDATINTLNAESNTLSSDSQRTGLKLLAIAALAVAAAVGASLWMATTAIARPLKGLAGDMKRLAGGDLEVAVTGQERRDEVGLMAQAVQVFKDNGLKARALAADAERLKAEADIASNRTEAQRRANEAEQAMVVQALAASLSRLAEGDLTTQIEAEFQGQYAQIKADFNAAVESLRGAMSAISESTSGIRGGSEEIAVASNDLSRRTEQQAANLEETAAALDQITATVRTSAAGAREASDAAAQATRDATNSGKVMRDAVSAMVEIEQSSSQINSIISVIDEIAFQTNLLALNAGVEAARAGDAGKGFAVVAQEVRALAQRSAEAAKEIKDLIAGSSAHVSRGVQLVGETEKALSDIVSKVTQIDGLISRIAQSSQEQATGLNQVNQAVNQLDQVTQQNAAMVEEATAAVSSLRGEAGKLTSLVARFNLQGGSARALAGRPGASGGLTVAEAQQRAAAFASASAA
ncbi:methyl-accepting chemotaxis protein [Caulobacter segnis]|nr:methyl-accepting chemotaxis protein [Caulobacter segnis]